jgi:hypothetical protein
MRPRCLAITNPTTIYSGINVNVFRDAMGGYMQRRKAELTAISHADTPTPPDWFTAPQSRSHKQ